MNRYQPMGNWSIPGVVLMDWIYVLILVIGLTPASPVFAQSTTGNTVTVGGDNNGGAVAGGNIINTTNAPTADTENGSMVSWLTDNATWLGSLAAIATIAALFLSLLSRMRSARESPSVTTVTAKGGSVAIGGDSINSKMTISSTSTNGVVGSSDSDSVTNQDNVTRVLLVFANPSDTDPLRVQEESRALRESIQLSAQRSHFQFETLPAATIDDLRRALLKDTYDIVHFSGHGTNDGLTFEDAMGKEMVPSSEALAQLLIRHQVGTAIFNACHSLSVGSFASTGLNYTIAITDEIVDSAAIEFSRGFYDAIGAGKGVEDAYEEGISSAQLKGYSPKIILLRRGEVYSPTADTV